MRQYSSKRYDEEFKKVKILFREAGIKMEIVSLDLAE